jgi:hypothetical protein
MDLSLMDRMRLRTRKRFLVPVLLLFACISAAPGVVEQTRVLAQPPAETAPQAGQSGPGATITAPQKSYILDAVIFAALAGGALFAICRSSRRV